ncbi:hypothetical protein SGQ44_00400 [Flavobacterium sp. Fl-77]|uniref:Uncharacterized protein n=1 Tax=Flavobacterium flavipigmentatum TaxID=2893884 RepID=A0AAJ2SDJ9_9FLAO|nr:MULTISPECIES: hypothetical protein [unclassified Flavobacterium]MDX6180593.1 hypothetical protein [Flavobacterium sp. Fl-33]MDX6184193.1 hypothetical protein [Flavobacterium sp. Fl-77]UFH39306.1 hypothetical protein LNP22_03300 [Flavobacterium sp. F-70]
MDNNIDFKDLWKKQKVNQPNIEELLLKIRQFKKAGLKSFWITNVLLIATSVFIGLVWYYYQPQFISTKIGIVVTILSMIIYLSVYSKLLSSFKTIDSDKSNQEYLLKLIEIKKKQHFLQSTMMNLYFIMLTIGIGLYMYEYAVRMTAFWAIFTYGITLLWFAFNWFYIRPKQIKKQEQKIDGLIAKFEAVNEQLASN